MLKEGSSPSSQMSRHGLLAEVFEVLALSLGPVIDESMANYFDDEQSWAVAASHRLGRPAEHGATDPLFQLLVLQRFWGPVFQSLYKVDLRPLITQLIDARNLWAHLNLPHDSGALGDIVLAAERLVAPVRPEAAGRLRQLRTAMRNLDDQTPDARPDDEETALSEISNEKLSKLALESQLVETEGVFQELQDKYGQVMEKLNQSRQATAKKQLVLLGLQNRLDQIERSTSLAQSIIESERATRNRIEWLFVGVLASILLVMVLSAGIS